MTSPINRHGLWKVELFFLYYNITIKVANFFSLSCVILCCSIKYYILLIASCIGYIIDVSIMVAARFKTCLCAAWLLGFGVRIPSRAWKSVSCDCSILSGRGISVWSTVRRSPTECWVSEWYLEASLKDRPLPKYGPKPQRKKKEINIFDALNVK